jgi:hypothetical protein
MTFLGTRSVDYIMPLPHSSFTPINPTSSSTTIRYWLRPEVEMRAGQKKSAK